MRILLLVETLTIGGLPNYVLELARALSERGETVGLAHGGGEVPEFLDCHGIELLALTPHGFTQPYTLSSAMQVLHDWKPDVLHLHLCSVLPLLEALPSLGVPLVRSFHDYTSMCLRRGRRRFPGDRCSRPLGWSCALQGCLLGAPAEGSRLPSLQNLPNKLKERALYQAFAASVVGSNHMRQVLLSNNFASDRVTVVPYFSRFDQQALSSTPAKSRQTGTAPHQERPLRLLFTGQAVKGKGLEVLINALAQLRGNWQLTAITSGPRLTIAKALAKQHTIDGRINFIEWLPQEQLADHYQHADLFVLPSVWDDPGPLVGIEAMSFETPVLAFPVGGIPDYVQDGRTGYLTKQVSVNALAASLQRAIEQTAQLPELGRAARALVAQQHSRQRHIDTLQLLYQRIAPSQTSPSHPAKELLS
ncbi:glycosyltransferase family 4 protein [Atopomonas hussainii]|uniref:glycosyltransferase family 4 protein n=1 Tax=Atopomonas hussainii TaxID=1429083 RepID=UPI0009000B04|nr:glycosyltransferase family 4 protein [Atopomonas hussainii]